MELPRPRFSDTWFCSLGAANRADGAEIMRQQCSPVQRRSLLTSSVLTTWDGMVPSTERHQDLNISKPSPRSLTWANRTEAEKIKPSFCFVFFSSLHQFNLHDSFIAHERSEIRSPGCSYEKFLWVCSPRFTLRFPLVGLSSQFQLVMDHYITAF